jgi:F-type H+-transporting ATPase subunit delta
MISGSIARRYAKALLALGVDGKNYEQLGAELSDFVRTLQSSTELREALESPVVPVSQRKAILGEVLTRAGASVVMRHFLLLLIDHNRMNAVAAIDREHRALVDAQAGRVRASLSSPQPVEQIDLALAGRIKAALEKLTGKTVMLELKQDPSLLAGVVVQIGDVIYDGSARAGLSRIREELLSG